MKNYELTGKDFLNLLLVKDLSLQMVAEWKHRSVKVTTIFDRICEYIKTLDEEEQIEILDKMYSSKKFTIFFTVAKAAILGKTIQEIKKKYGVTQYHMHNVELLKKTPLLKEEVEGYKEAWDKTEIIYVMSNNDKKGNTNSVQIRRGTW